MTTWPRQLTRWWRGGPFQVGLVAGFVLLNALVLSLVWLSISRDRDDHRRRAVVATHNIAQLIERDLTEVLQHCDRDLQTVADEVAREADMGGVDRERLAAFIDLAFAHRAVVDGLHVLDARGEAIYRGRAGRLALPEQAEHDLVTRLRDDARTGPLVSSLPAAGDEAGILVARALHNVAGTYDGVVYTLVGPDRLRAAFAGVDLGSNGLVAVRDLELRPVVRLPPLPGSDRLAPSAEFRLALLASPDDGSFTSKNPYDGVERTNSFRRLAAGPLYVIVGLSTDDYLLGWEREALPTLILAACFALATFALTEVLGRYLRRRDEAMAMLARQEARLRGLIDAAPDALVVIDGRGLISMINQRAESMFDYRRSELIGQPVEILLPQARHVDHAAHVRRYIGDPRTRSMGVGRTLTGRAKSGREFRVSISLSPIETDEGLMVAADIRDLSGVER